MDGGEHHKVKTGGCNFKFLSPLAVMGLPRAATCNIIECCPIRERSHDPSTANCLSPFCRTKGRENVLWTCDVVSCPTPGPRQPRVPFSARKVQCWGGRQGPLTIDRYMGLGG